MAEKQCENRATVRRFWPGSPPDLVCATHAIGWRNIASIMGFHLHTEPISEDVPEVDRKCCNMVRAEE
jgi:hypothetical protein